MIGKVTHYYDKLGVAIVELKEDLKAGDKVKFVRGGEDLFEQEISSLQVEHKQVKSAKNGDVIGIKVDEEVKEGAEIHSLE